MKYFMTGFISGVFIMAINLIFIFEIEGKQIQKELKEIKQTLDYIDTRMDTLEFFKVPESKKHAN